MSVRVCRPGEELQNEEELDKELLWNLQLLSEVRQDLQHWIYSGLQPWKL